MLVILPTKNIFGGVVVGKTKKEMAAELAGKIIKHAHEVGLPLEKKKPNKKEHAKAGR